MPKKVVVIGAGPIGLYMAYLLSRKGADVVVYDPRAGEYTRPGHLNENVFRAIERGIQKQFWRVGRGHIKEIQRFLHDFVKAQGASIEKKTFVRFNQGAESQGVVVADENGREEFIACDHVFDATGSARVLINQINNLSNQKPFTLQAISSEINVENHFLAYVKMTANDLSRVAINGDETTILGKRTPLEYAMMMEQLRAFGWREFGLPNFYGQPFGKNKVCLYLESPDNLPKASQEPWVKLVINVNSGTQDISFTQIPDKPNKPKKPKFTGFKVVPNELMQVAHKAPGKPMLMVVGDAQIDPNYTQAHGITDGVARADAMIDNMDFYHGEIAYFDPDEYARSIKDMLKRHRDSIIKYYHNHAQYFQTWLYEAEKHYTVAIEQVKGTAQAAIFQKTLKEIQARIHYDKAQKLRASLYDATGKIAFDKVNLDTVSAQLTALNTHLSKALEDLPVTFIKERQKALNMLKEAAISFKELGNQYFKKQALLKAGTAYESALNIYQNPLLANQHFGEELTVYSNLIITLRKNNRNDEALAIAVHVISSYPPEVEFITVKTKIMFNLINALKALKSAKYEYIDDVCAALIKRAKECVKGNPHLLTPALKAEFDQLFPEKNIPAHTVRFLTGVDSRFLKEFPFPEAHGVCPRAVF